MTMTTVRASNLEVGLDDLGSGEPALVCLPGWCGGREVFKPLLDRLSESGRVLAIDLPGQGESAAPEGDFDTAYVVDVLLEILDSAGVDRVVPVALSHAGWIGIEIRRRLSPERVPALVLLDWMVLGAPPGFADALAGLQDPNGWQAVRAGLFGMWTAGVDVPAVHRYVESMGSYGAGQWGRAGREISAGFATETSPLAALGRLDDPCPTLHVYAQPPEDAVLAAQMEFAAANPWFSVRRVAARGHFPMFEQPDAIAQAIRAFVSERV